MSTYPRVPRRLQRPPPRAAAPPASDAPAGLLERYKELLGLSTVAAGVSYATLWLAYAQFYLPLGTTPEEAGIDKTDLLTQAIVGPAVFFVVALVAIYVYALFFAFMGTFYGDTFRDAAAYSRYLFKRLRRQPVRRPPSQTPAEKRAYFRAAFIRQIRKSKRILYVAIPAAYVVLCLLLYTESVTAASHVRRGEAVVNPSLSIGAVSVPLVGIRAAPVFIEWLQEPPTASLRDPAFGDCLMHLGEADGRALLYDVRLEVLVRIPATDALFALDLSESLPLSCRPPD